MSMPEFTLPDNADGAMPRHVAIIMDGNGRWAAARGLPRGEGHRRGVEALRKTVRAAGELGIGVLTIFSFSAENWSRPASEVRDLMGLLRRFIRNDLADLHASGVKVRVIGERDDLLAELAGERPEHVVLRFEVLVEGGPRAAGAVRDQLDMRGIEAHLGERFHRRGEDTTARIAPSIPDDRMPERAAAGDVGVDGLHVGQGLPISG